MGVPGWTLPFSQGPHAPQVLDLSAGPPLQEGKSKVEPWRWLICVPWGALLWGLPQMTACVQAELQSSKGPRRGTVEKPWATAIDGTSL